jgi:hypothetical protein
MLLGIATATPSSDMSGTDRPQNLFSTASDRTYAGAAWQGVHPLSQGLPLLQHSYAQERGQEWSIAS